MEKEKEEVRGVVEEVRGVVRRVEGEEERWRSEMREMRQEVDELKALLPSVSGINTHCLRGPERRLLED